MRLNQWLVLAVASCLVLTACEDSDVRLGREALQANDPDKALRFFSIAVERKHDASVQGYIAQALARKGSIVEASRWMRDAHSAGLSGPAAAKLWSAEASLSLSLDTPKAITLYNLAVDYDKSVADTAATLLLNTADGALSGQSNRALQLYDAAVKFDAKLAIRAAKTLTEAAVKKLPAEVDTALLFFKYAVKYDPTLSKTASNAIYDLAAAKIDAELREGVRLMGVSAEYDSSRRAALGEFLAAKAIVALKADNIDRAEVLTRNAISYNSSVAKPISDAAFLRAKELARNSDNWRTVAALGRFVPHKTSDTVVWGPLLEGLLTELASKPTAAKDIVDVARLAVAFDPTRRPSLSKLLMGSGTTILDRTEYDLVSARTLYDTAIDFEPSNRAAVMDDIWKQFVRRLFAPGQLAKDSFLRFFDMAAAFGTPSREANSVAPYCWALKEYFEGTRASALDTLSRIAKNRPNSREGRASAAILAEPRPKFIKHTTQPFIFNTSTFWTQSSIQITLISTEVVQSETILTFHLKHNTGAPASLVYQKENYDRGALGGKCERLHLIDDNGAKLYSYSGFTGGVQEAATGDCYQHIRVGVGEEVTVSARFPMITSGATTVKFVSNPIPGGQGDWGWQGIQVKAGPFDVDVSNRRDIDSPTPGPPPSTPPSAGDTSPARPPAAQPSFNCGSATTVIEKTICDNGDLAVLDQRLGRIYRTKYDALNEKDRQDLVREQRAFIADRNIRCGRDMGPRIIACLSTSIEERIRQLGAAPTQSSPRSNPPPLARPATAPAQSGTNCFMFNGRQVCE